MEIVSNSNQSTKDKIILDGFVSLYLIFNLFLFHREIEKLGIYFSWEKEPVFYEYYKFWSFSLEVPVPQRTPRLIG